MKRSDYFTTIELTMTTNKVMHLLQLSAEVGCSAGELMEMAFSSYKEEISPLQPKDGGNSITLVVDISTDVAQDISRLCHSHDYICESNVLEAVYDYMILADH